MACHQRIDLDVVVRRCGSPSSRSCHADIVSPAPFVGVGLDIDASVEGLECMSDSEDDLIMPGNGVTVPSPVADLIVSEGRHISA